MNDGRGIHLPTYLLTASMAKEMAFFKRMMMSIAHLFLLPDLSEVVRKSCCCGFIIVVCYAWLVRSGTKRESI